MVILCYNITILYGIILCLALLNTKLILIVLYIYNITTFKMSLTVLVCQMKPLVKLAKLNLQGKSGSLQYTGMTDQSLQWQGSLEKLPQDFLDSSKIFAYLSALSSFSYIKSYVRKPIPPEVGQYTKRMALPRMGNTLFSRWKYFSVIPSKSNNIC